MNKAQRKGSLIRQITKAFSDIPYPGDESILSPGIRTFDDEVLVTRRDYIGKDWRQLSLEFVRQHHNNMIFLSSKAFRCFLPAYLIATLELDWSEPVKQTLVHLLTPPPYGLYDRDDFATDISLLTEKQREILADYFHYLWQEENDNAVCVTSLDSDEPQVLIALNYY